MLAAAINYPERKQSRVHFSRLQFGTVAIKKEISLDSFQLNLPILSGADWARHKGKEERKN